MQGLAMLSGASELRGMSAASASNRVKGIALPSWGIWIAKELDNLCQRYRVETIYRTYIFI
jgi:hypothetical protein